MLTAAIETARLRARSSASLSGAIAVALSLAPLGLLLMIAADSEITPLIGISGMIVVVATTIAWTVMGTMVILETSSVLARSIALLVFTIPATVIAVLGPWVVLATLRP